jgi:nucleotide-binding universal stress UspA family protein
MYTRIMVPVDLAHVDRLEKALGTAADLARHYGAGLTLVGATGTEPGPVARSPEEFADKLDRFAAEVGERLGIGIEASTLHLHDMSIELDHALIRKAADIGADLIVMASHVPGAAEYLFGSNAGHVAQHAPISVMIVRGT